MAELIREYLGEIIAGVFGIAGTFWAYVTGRKRTDAETEQIKSGALQGIQAVYDKFVIDTSNKMDEFVKEITHLTVEVKDLRNIVHNLEKDLDDCRKGINKMTSKID